MTIKLNGKDWTWSASKVRRFTECPFRFFKEFIQLEVSYTKNPAFAIGEGIHEAVEQMSLDRAIGMSVEEIKKNINKYIVIYVEACRNSSNYEESYNIEEFANMIPYYIDNARILTPKKRKIPVSRKINGVWTKHWYWTEGWGDLKLPFTDTILKLKIDIVTENEAIVDYKTSSSKYSKKAIAKYLEDPALQLSIYGCWFVQEFGIYPTVAWQVIDKKCNFIQEVGFKTNQSITRDTLNLLKHTHTDFLKYLGKGDFPAWREKGDCYNCSYKRYCY